MRFFKSVGDVRMILHLVNSELVLSMGTGRTSCHFCAAEIFMMV
jgi:hypothetical protein